MGILAYVYPLSFAANSQISKDSKHTQNFPVKVIWGWVLEQDICEYHLSSNNFS